MPAHSLTTSASCVTPRSSRRAVHTRASTSPPLNLFHTAAQLKAPTRFGRFVLYAVEDAGVGSTDEPTEDTVISAAEPEPEPEPTPEPAPEPESEPEPEPSVSPALSAAAAAAAAIQVDDDDDEGEEMAAEEIKAALLDSLFGTDRGLSASSEVRAEINELISQLEANNPTPSPTEAEAALSGTWKLVYTSNSELLALLAASKLPLVEVGAITQTVSVADMSVENKVEIGVPFSRTAFSTMAKLETRSPKRLQIKFEEGVIQTPELLEDVPLPSSTTILGQTVDLTPLVEALRPVQSSLRPAVSQLSNLIAQQPDLKFPIEGASSQTWLLTTYLDSDTRISRGDNGSIYILVKDAMF